MFNNPNWRWIFQLALIISAIVLIPTVIIPAVSDLISEGIQSAGETIDGIFRPIGGRGDTRLKGLIQLCLYLIFIISVVKWLTERKS